MPQAERVRALEKWAAKPGADGRVPTLAELTGPAPQAGTAQQLHDLSRDAWRGFRSHLDHCVHYAGA